MAQEKVMVSACLAGVNCVYDGTNRYHPVFGDMAAQKQAVLFCPEALGGMTTPHSPSEIQNGDGRDVVAGRARVVSKDGVDVTDLFLEGARRTLNLAGRRGATRAILKARSPSCGCGKIYDGTFTRALRDGEGVTTALLRENGIEVMSDEEYLETLKKI
jgi:uncharacterized protein YbbK (DUF523 family)